MRFEFATAGRIIFGNGTLKEAGQLASGLGKRVLVVTGRSRERAQRLLDILEQAHIETAGFHVTGEPTLDLVRQGTRLALREKCDVVVGFGGGSAMDAGKAIAAIAANGGDPLDYLEVIGRGKKFASPSLPCIAIPTTAGTGTEVTRNAVLADADQRLKASLRSPILLPRIALVDPELTYSMSPELTASSGLDALIQLIEPFISKKANWLVDALCREGLGRVARSLRRVYHNAENREARAEMAYASMLSGMALANAGLGAIHGFAAPVGGMFDAPHGALCAAMLPYAMAVNANALQEREHGGPSLRKFDEIARLLTGDARATAQDGIAWVRDLCLELRVPSLGSYGIAEQDFLAIIEKASASSSMQGNPIRLTHEEMREILSRSL